MKHGEECYPRSSTKCSQKTCLSYPEGEAERGDTNFIDNVFAVLPTGYGKNLYYTCLPIAYDNILKTKGSIVVVVVTPLTAIIEDQVSAMYSAYTYIYNIYIYVITAYTIGVFSYCQRNNCCRYLW